LNNNIIIAESNSRHLDKSLVMFKLTRVKTFW